MINPYAQAFMIAARTDRIAPPRLRAARDAKPRERRFRLFDREAKPSRWRAPRWFVADASGKSL